MTTLMLKRLGFKVLSAADGFEAVKIFSQNPNKIRLVLSDLTMPLMNGWKTLAALRKIRPNVPVILSSGYNEAQAMAGEQEEKPDSFLHKPYQLNTLKETIKKVLKN
jgi:CheY-like chemotaxis protein